MKIAIAAAAAAALALPAVPTFAGHMPGTVLGAPQFQSYSNRGACESALAAERNRQRKNAATRGAGYEDLSGSDFNRASRTTTRCEERNGQWVVVFYSHGFPG